MEIIRHRVEYTELVHAVHPHFNRLQVCIVLAFAYRTWVGQVGTAVSYFKIVDRKAAYITGNFRTAKRLAMAITFIRRFDVDLMRHPISVVSERAGLRYPEVEWLVIKHPHQRVLI